MGCKLNKDLQEPFIIINGTVLDEAMSKTLRVAIESFASTLICYGLDDETGKAISEGYINQIIKIRKVIFINEQ